MHYLDIAGRGPGLVPPDQALIPAGDRGLLYGDGLFETMLARDGSVARLDRHLARLAASAAALALPLPDGVARAVALVAAAAGPGTHALRLTLTRGTSARRGYEPPADARPTLLITAAPYRPPAGPLTAITASVRVNPDSPLSRHKSLSALEKVLARAEAAQAGASEALLLNIHGRVAEGAASNLFIRRGGRWVTPPVSEGCLPGVMRAEVMAETGAVEAPLTAADLFAADAVYLSNALMGLVPLARLDGRPLPGSGTDAAGGRRCLDTTP